MFIIIIVYLNMVIFRKGSERNVAVLFKKFKK